MLIPSEGKASLTVFTPTYNRAHTLPRVYESLRRQSCKDFVWLIVDDGSRDETKELVRRWQQDDSGFELRYIWKENGGMHTAHNVAYENIETELNVCIDSDDVLADGAVGKILRKWESVRELGYAGLMGLDADFEGNVIGRGFPPGMRETTVIGYYAQGGSGDKKLVYRTDVINSVPSYPVFPGEKYVGLSYKYRLIDQQYKMAVLDDVLCNVEYQAEGSSRNMLRQYLDNPRGFAFLRTVYMRYPYSKTRLFIDCIHYCSSCILAEETGAVRRSPRKLLTALCMPAGAALAACIRMNANMGGRK